MDMDEQIVTTCFELSKHYLTFVTAYMEVNDDVRNKVISGFNKLFKKCKSNSNDINISIFCYANFKLEIEMKDVFIGKNDKFKYEAKHCLNNIVHSIQ